MADGFRVTEDGTKRVTESSDFRITERLEVGASTLTAEATVSAVAITVQEVFGSLASTGSKLSAGELTAFGHVSLAAEGTSSQTGNLVFDLTKGLDSSGSLSVVPTLKLSGLSSLSSTGTIEATGFRIYFLESSLIGSGDLTSEASQVINASYFSGFEEFTRITETGDRRVTEDGQVRLTEEIPVNIGEGTIVSFGNRVPFSAEPYVKIVTDWKLFTPYVNYNDNWVVPDRLYKNINGNWKRIF